MERRGLKAYLMRVDESLWRRVKSKAALEGLTMREVIEELFKVLLNNKVKIKSHKGGDFEKC